MNEQGCGSTPPLPPGNSNPSAASSDICTRLASTFDASASSGSDGVISSYRWDFGDATESTQAVSNHTYAVAGTYTVVGTVADNEGATDTSSKTVTVTDSTEPPAISH
ncbi:MAG: PKD domain-containing protein [Pseudomonadales bacterium]|nr:PKD domain-containing protein [Pseudomonadales bacterium]